MCCLDCLVSKTDACAMFYAFLTLVMLQLASNAELNCQQSKIYAEIITRCSLGLRLQLKIFS